MRQGVQQYRCNGCARYLRSTYRYKAHQPDTDKQLIAFTKEGCGIRSISRLLGISPSTVIARCLRIAQRLAPPTPIAYGRHYEVDEISTYCGYKKKRIWLAYALDRKNRQVVAMVVGRRTKRMLGRIVSTLLLAKAERITTDGLAIYQLLITEDVHRVKGFGINRIERHNLTLRTRLRRLGRRTICYSKQAAMLQAFASIMVWG
ncbi:MAG: IS1 family transposase [Flavobacteriales bacterium]|nr:IS1 family transposase [Flavobacteriales bacterium]